MAEFTHNNWPNETMRKSPFFLLMGYNPHADWTDHSSPIPQVALQLNQFKQARKHAEELMVKAQKSWVKNRDTPKYKVGDQVWLEGHHLRTNQPTMKLVPRRHGPFRVVQVMSPVNYHLELPMQWSIHPVFHIDLLTPYRKTPTHGPNYQHPPPDLVDREEEYEVERSLDSRRFSRRHKLQYLVKWKGYPDSENQWVDKDDVFTDKALQEFKTLNPILEVHTRHLHIPEDRILTSSVKYCTCPLPHHLPLRMLSSPPKTPKIIPFPVSSVNSLNPNVVRFLPTSWNTKTQGLLTPEAIRRERAWKQMVLEWRREQISRACLSRHPQSVSQLKAIYPTCFAPTDVPQNIVMTTNIIQSLSLLRRASTLSAMSSNTCTRPRSKVSNPLSGIPSMTTTATKKTTRMPQEYRPNLRGKGWVREDVAEEDAEEVDEV